METRANDDGIFPVAVFITQFPLCAGLDIASVGFTAAAGATADTIKILNWTYDGIDVDS